MALNFTPQQTAELMEFVKKIAQQEINQALKNRNVIQGRTGTVTAVQNTATPPTATVRLLGQDGTDTYINETGGDLAINDIVYLQTTLGSLNSLIIVRQKP